jgi:exopolysaccharide production protein ExoQ
MPRGRLRAGPASAMTDAMTMSAQRLPASPRQRFFDSFQRGYAMFAIMVYEGAFTSSLRYLRGGDHLLPGETEITSTIFQAIILSVLCWMWWLKRRYLVAVMKDIFPYLLILLLCALSAFWSDYQFPTLRRSVTLSSCVFFGAYCYLQFGVKGTLELLGRATVIVALISLFVFIAIPSIGTETALGYESAMRGVFSQKNSLGEAMLLAISCYVYLLVDNPKSVTKPLLRLGLLFFCIILARSATSLVIAMIVVAAGAIFWSQRSWRRRAVVLYILITMFCVVTALAIFDTAQLLGYFNRDVSFTGRLPLWEASLEAAMQQPWLGYGYSGFWNQDSIAVQAIWAAIDWQAPSSHNGYIDILLQIGIIGLFLYAWVWGGIVVNSVLAWREGSLREARWILLFMLINILLNLDEGPLPYPDQFTVLMPGAILVLANWRRERAVRRASLRQRRMAPRAFVATKSFSRRGG